MPHIELLNNETIDKIAAGEVVERPFNVVKELVENSIDAGSTAITIEIKGGGSELIRITDNGCGIKAEECKTAFLRHATSKLRTIEDLDTLVSLGFRGEALSSICAVSKTEMITKPKDDLLGTRICVDGGKLCEESQIGAPNGTTMIIRQLFFNTPARRKFLKSPTSEAAMIEDMIEKFALSHPEIAFQLIMGGKTRISSSGNGNLKDVVYHIFGKEIYDVLLPVDYEENGIHITGFTAKPEFSYQARNGELYFVNGRFVNSKIVKVAIEQVYSKYLMQHRFPFCVLFINVPTDTIDVNVHPQKMEIKFSENEMVSNAVTHALEDAFKEKELIPEVKIDASPIEKHVEKVFSVEKTASSDDLFFDAEDSGKDAPPLNIPQEIKRIPEPFEIKRQENLVFEKAPEYVQETIFEKKLINDEPLKRYTIIGQVFDTYWLITLDDDLYIVDQHAAHEKVNYEHFVHNYEENNESYGQQVNPPIMIHLSAREEACILQYMDVFTRIGYEIEDFGMGSYAIRSVPVNMFGSDETELFHRLLEELMEKDSVFSPSVVLEKLASMSCKAAIKGGQKISALEMENLMTQLMTLENPYNCPHGRPVFIKMTRSDLEKKFKRIV